jgi:hypothetical protein
LPAVLIYADHPDSVVVALTTGIASSIFMVFVAWWHRKEYFTWAPKHSLSINSANFTLSDPGAVTVVELNSIEKIYVNMSRDKVKSVVLIRAGGFKERLPRYSDLHGLVKEFELYLGQSKVEYRKFRHV